MAILKTDTVIIGGGPGGYVCAIKAGQLGIDTILVEEDAHGGTCLNVGCIPSKALIHAGDEYHRLGGLDGLGITASGTGIDMAATMAWKDRIVRRLTNGVGGLLKKAGVRVIDGKAAFIDGKTVRVTSDTGEVVIEAENVVIATGSAPVELPLLPFGGRVINSTGALQMDELPARLAVIGAGYIGLEIGTALAKMGVAVTVIEAEDRILPQYDAALTGPVADMLARLGVDVRLNSRAQGLDGAALTVEGPGGEARVEADRVLVTVGRRPRTDSANIVSLGLRMKGVFIDIDARCRTSMRGVYAVGDVTGEPMLAHRAMAQGEMVAELIAGARRSWDKVAIPAVVFTDPEIVTCGQSPDEANNSGLDVEIGQFPFAANGRAMTLDRDDGFVRVVARRDTGVVAGIQAVGAGVAELSSAFAIAMEMGARSEDIARTIHAHPTLSEAFAEAGHATLGRALHN